MRYSSSAHRGMSPFQLFTIVLAVLFLGGIGTAGTLLALGVIDLSFLKTPLLRVADKPAPTGVPVLVSGRPIPAYTKITPDYLFEPATSNPSIRYVSQELVEKRGLITDINKILGRVLKRDKAAGFAFIEKDDFFPEGTRPGIVASVPIGKRAFVLQADKIQGIHALKAGDNFDLVASLPVDLEKVMRGVKAGGSLDPVLASQSGGNLPKRASVKPLVQNGVVVLPVTIREVPTGAGAHKPGTPMQTKPVQEITIAIEAEEVAPLSEALAIHAEVCCVARSGQPMDSSREKNTPGSIATPNVRTLESIVGLKRQILVFPKEGEGPRDAMPLDTPTRDLAPNP